MNDGALCILRATREVLERFAGRYDHIPNPIGEQTGDASAVVEIQSTAGFGEDLRKALYANPRAAFHITGPAKAGGEGTEGRHLLQAQAKLEIHAVDIFRVGYELPMDRL